MPFLEPSDMLHGEPLAGWAGSFFHAQNMTFALYEISADATPLHEHFHEQEEVWNIVAGEIAITIDGVERKLGPGSAAVVPPNTPHSVRPLGDCRVVIADHPVRLQLPGNPSRR